MLPYTIKVVMLQLICSFLFPSPLFVGMLVDSLYNEVHSLAKFFIALSPLITAFIFLLVSLSVFYFRLAKVDDLLGEGVI
jgi:hypothetical protein